MSKITVQQAATALGMSVQSLRVGLQQNKIPFGTAWKNGSRYTYLIYPEKFKEIKEIDNV